MGKRIFVGNLPWSVGFEKLKELFSPYGEVEDALVISDKQTRRSRGFGFVTFKEESSAQAAIAEMNEKSVEGRNIKVTEAAPFKEGPKEKAEKPSNEAESEEKVEEATPQEEKSN